MKENSEMDSSPQEMELSDYQQEQKVMVYDSESQSWLVGKVTASSDRNIMVQISRGPHVDQERFPERTITISDPKNIKPL